MYNISFDVVLALKSANVVSTFPTVYSACLQEKEQSILFEMSRLHRPTLPQKRYYTWTYLQVYYLVLTVSSNSSHHAKLQKSLYNNVVVKITLKTVDTFGNYSPHNNYKYKTLLCDK